MKCFIVEKREEQISRCISEMFHCRVDVLVKCFIVKEKSKLLDVLVKCFIVEKREEQIIRCIVRKEKSKLLDVLVKCFIVEKREEQIIRCISEMFHCREKRRANY